MPSWQRDEEAAHGIDTDALTRASHAIVDLVFTEDSAFIDALPDAVQIDLIPTMSVLIGVLDNEPPNPRALWAAARMTRDSILSNRRECPPELVELALNLPCGP